MSIHKACNNARLLTSALRSCVTTSTVFDTRFKRFLFASGLWLISWPTLYFFKLGEITGPKAWFWIIGELNYPIVAVAYVVIDSMLSRWLEQKPLMIFWGTVLVIGLCMPVYYQKYGFALGVTIEARYL